MKKKIILVVVILLTAITTVFAQTAADFSVELTNDGNGVVIKRYTGKVLAIKVPDTIEGLPVREIGKQAFSGRGNITSVTLPQGLTKIGEEAFKYQSNLASVVIPNSVTEIGNQAFSQCSALKSIDIPDSVTSFGFGIFASSGIEKFTLGKGITVIPIEMFVQCKLTSIVIPEGITEISSNAFRENSMLTSVTLPSTIKKISNNAFGICGIISITIPDSVEAIEFGNEWSNDVFRGCPKLNLASQAALKKRGYTGSF